MARSRRRRCNSCQLLLLPPGPAPRRHRPSTPAPPHRAHDAVKDEGCAPHRAARQHTHSKVGKRDAVLAQRMVRLALRPRQRLQGRGAQGGGRAEVGRRPACQTVAARCKHCGSPGDASSPPRRTCCTCGASSGWCAAPPRCSMGRQVGSGRGAGRSTTGPAGVSSIRFSVMSILLAGPNSSAVSCGGREANEGGWRGPAGAAQPERSLPAPAHAAQASGRARPRPPRPRT